eukprot:gene28295-31405_t
MAMSLRSVPSKPVRVASTAGVRIRLSIRPPGQSFGHRSVSRRNVIRLPTASQSEASVNDLSDVPSDELLLENDLSDVPSDDLLLENDLSDVPSDDLLLEVSRRLECAKMPQRRIILIGPPGCGKGTAAPAIKKATCTGHLATGDMLRAAVAAKSALGLEAEMAMDSGDLILDEPVVGLIEVASKTPQCAKGFS